MKNQKAILLRVSMEDNKFIQEQADKLRMTKSGYLRYVAIIKPKNHNSKIKKLNRKLEKLKKL